MPPLVDGTVTLFRAWRMSLESGGCGRWLLIALEASIASMRAAPPEDQLLESLAFPQSPACSSAFGNRAGCGRRCIFLPRLALVSSPTPNISAIDRVASECGSHSGSKFRRLVRATRPLITAPLHPAIGRGTAHARHQIPSYEGGSAIARNRNRKFAHA